MPILQLIRTARAILLPVIAWLAIAAGASAATFYFGGAGGGGTTLTGTPSLISQTQGATTNCSNGAGNPSGCSTGNPSTAGIDPTNLTYGAKGDARGVGAWFGTAPQTTLNGAVTSGATSIVVTSSTGFPSSGQFSIFVDKMSSTTTFEEITVTSVSGNTWTVTRGANGTSGVSHLSGAVVIGLGDGTWNYNDATCGTAHQCFRSASGNFTAGDVGKVISINGISSFNSAADGSSFLGTPPFVQTAFNTFVTVSSVQSTTQLILSAIPTISTANQLYSGLAWVMGTNDLATFQSAVTAGDLHIPNHYYLFAPYTSSAFPNGANAAVAVPAHRDIWCDSGATIIDVSFDQFDGGESAIFYNNSNGDQHYRNCTFEGTNVGAPGFPNFLGTATDHELFIDLYTNATPGPSNIYIIGNTFKYNWGQSMVETEEANNGNYATNVQIINNTFVNCGLYGPVFTVDSYSAIAFNTLTDCSGGAETNGSQANYPYLYDYVAGNSLTCVYGSGNRYTYLTTDDQSASVQTTDDAFDNIISGVSFNRYCGYDSSQGTPQGNYYNNQAVNGAGWH